MSVELPDVTTAQSGWQYEDGNAVSFTATGASAPTAGSPSVLARKLTFTVATNKLEASSTYAFIAASTDMDLQAFHASHL